MSSIELFREIAATYRRHGWELRRALVRVETLAEISARGETIENFLEGSTTRESFIDALWFARPSADRREAWELRHVAETPFALFELFEPDEAEEDREDVRREMESQMIERVSGKTND